MRPGIYHEKQRKSLCALHALNNLFQDGAAFKQEDLDEVCRLLAPNSWVNPHRSVFGLGNYDINIIMSALQPKGCEAVWFDKRKDPSDLNFSSIFGFILNIPSDCKLGWLALPLKRKHWVAIRNLPSPVERDAGRSQFYNLDSKFDAPEAIGDEGKLVEFLREELKSAEKELFIIVTSEVGRNESWKKQTTAVPPPSSTTTTTNPPGTLGIPNSHLEALTKEERKGSADSGVVEMLPDLRDMNVVDLDKEDLLRRQSSGVWSDYN